MTYILKINLTRCYKSWCCPIMCVYVQSNDVRFVFTFSCLSYLRYLCLLT